MENRQSLRAKIRAAALGMRSRRESSANRTSPPFDFDQLALDLARGLSRRQALARLGGLLLGALVASLGLDRAWAACPLGQNPCSTGDLPFCCPAGQACLDPTTRSCGPCSANSPCGPGQLCCGGACLTNCAGQCCDGICCNNTCFPAGSTCCTGVGACPAAFTCCQDQYCAGLQNDVRNCGACGFACMSGQLCRNGQCIAGCPDGETLCGASCVNTQTDRLNCGDCGRACGSDPSQICCQGVCRSCTGAAVGGECCGSKGFACCQHGSGESCCDGLCCPAGQHCANGACQPGCVGDENCPVSRFCVNGACLPCKGVGEACDQNKECCSHRCQRSPLTGARFCAPCPDGQTLCGESCVNTQTDRQNCGGCGSVCGQELVCSSGLCCPPDQTGCHGVCQSCSSRFAEGCCGAKGFACCERISGESCCDGVCCPAGQHCVNGVCQPGCLTDANCNAASGQHCVNGVCCAPHEAGCQGSGGSVCCDFTQFLLACCGSKGSVCCAGLDGATCCDGLCCPAGQHCANGACQPGCVSDMNCPPSFSSSPNHHCSNGACCAGGDVGCQGSSGPVCCDPSRFLQACCGSKGSVCCSLLRGESCCDGICCPAGQHCENGVCQPGCLTDANCVLGQHCSSGACCASHEAGCQGSSGSVCCDYTQFLQACCGSKGSVCCDVARGESCCDGACCPGGQHCENGACVPGCLSNANCVPEQPCCNGVCCPAGQTCRTNPFTGARFCG